MSNSWLSALKSIPWGNVLEHAPKVLDKARNYMSAKETQAPTPPPVEAMSPGEVEVQLAGALINIKKLQQQIYGLNLKTSELVEQQTLLKSEVQSLRSRDRWQKAIILVGLVGAAVYFGTPYFK